MGKSIFFILIFLFSIVSLNYAYSMSSSNFQITSDVAGVSGSEAGSSANFGLRDTIGEPIAEASTSTSANFGVASGFRQLHKGQTLTFSAGVSTSDIGDLSTSAASTTSHTLTVISDAFNGITVTVSGNTLTKGVDTITAIGSTEKASAAGTEQFGLNLVANTTPSVGAASSGTSPIAAAANHYNAANLFAFTSGDTVATSTGPINETTFTVSYIANAASATEGGDYTTTLTFTASGSW